MSTNEDLSNIKLDVQVVPASDNAGAMTNQEYAECGGNQCPHCRSDDVEASRNVEVDVGYASQLIQCNSCKAEWWDNYILVGYEDV